MNIWFLKGIKSGIKTEDIYKSEYKPQWSTEITGSGDVKCPTNAISNNTWDSRRCIYCRRCYPEYNINGNDDISIISGSIDKKFRKSLNIYSIDSGTCGACNSELFSISIPEYDLTRYHIFFTNTPRHADAIILSGIYNESMKDVIDNALGAMPKPGYLILLGACALSGGIIGSGHEIKAVLEIPGCPPNPYTILKGLRRLML
ncbi:NADH-quinone oxidoreductase subunit B family protein [Picrophilus oshimae]|uniref:Formate hydrogenlyase subunit 7 n=1 Tax=Picrophilus torridus (strain ATCC 700027 / DSM 9790 / JCM 10055 / NBRC 100828 / KAW 2/3) TaxID=1122961 RepID=Q6L0U2_PICTO|nr:NADH ubiquinone oxidoreductase [Picrophilus oshimae]AAT43410.1 formate hydrogenlyase subunit 7 [Picrophilus oshimae DSM 9789]SMD30279.1 Ni,Fe-hydrogenase III small subunit [Picrophilus oshimae DSM 9789]